jgi:hypothetical protein
MSIKDTIKSLEEADQKLEKAAVLEGKAVTIQRDAARLREESQRDLDKVRIERQNFEQIQAARETESEQKEQDLKNRERKLAAAQSTLEHNAAANKKDFEATHTALDARSVAVDKADRQNKEFAETLDKRAQKYNSIADFISKTL